jgi:hypothetical protein
MGDKTEYTFTITLKDCNEARIEFFALPEEIMRKVYKRVITEAIEQGAIKKEQLRKDQPDPEKYQVETYNENGIRTGIRNLDPDKSFEENDIQPNESIQVGEYFDVTVDNETDNSPSTK